MCFKYSAGDEEALLKTGSPGGNCVEASTKFCFFGNGKLWA